MLLSSLTARALLTAAALSTTAFGVGSSAQAATVPAKPTGVKAVTQYYFTIGQFSPGWVAKVTWNRPAVVSPDAFWLLTTSGSCALPSPTWTTSTSAEFRKSGSSGVCKVTVQAGNEAGLSEGVTVQALLP
ncbi:hypothetical protein ACIB24_05500 [Spongisporangium articulatum]|uniref:Uncharacterized protein n=1 Tax=Spongisporangium articulatum TaxID=3362603 RepID=A0ABW8AJI6_9ACTN